MHKQLAFIFFIFVVTVYGCNSNSKSGRHQKSSSSGGDTSHPVVNSKKPDYNIYIENSASMDGYVAQASDFKNGLYKLVGDIHNYNLSDKLRLNFINDIVCPQKLNVSTPEIIGFIQHLKPADFKNSGCETKNSFLPDIIAKTISTNPSDVNILVSDCIFSSQKGSSGSFLSAAKESVRTYVKTALDQNEVSSVVLKMNSRFYGTYFIENKSTGKKTETLNGENRPYYIIIFGRNDKIRELLSKTKLSDYPGFEKSYYLLVPDAATPTSKVIRSNKIGDFVIEQPATKLIINGAKADNESEGAFQFSVAASLESVKMDETYLANTTNYEVPSNYKLTAITKNTDNTDVNLKEFTHIFTMNTSDLKQDQDVFIKLKSKLPGWVNASSTENDSEPLDTAQQKQTFGLKYLIEGISQAYADKYNDKEQFGISVHVSTNKAGDHTSSSKFPWWLLIVVVAVVGVLVYLKNKKS